MTSITTLIAGFSGGPGQNHQGDMWVPALASAGIGAVGVWVPPTTGALELQNARAVADGLGLDVQVSERPSTDADSAIVCLVGEERREFLAHAARIEMPVLLDKPTLDSTEQLKSVAAVAGRIATPYHFSHSPGFRRALTAVRNAEIGLLRGVFADLVVAHGDGSYPGGELRNLGVYLVDLMRQSTGPATVRLQSHESEGAWSLLGQTERDVVVSAHVSRTSLAAGGSGILRAAVRFLGTHGTLRVDLTRPAINVHRPGEHHTTPFGENSLTALLRSFADAVQGKGRFSSAAELLVVSEALDGIAASAASGTATDIQW